MPAVETRPCPPILGIVPCVSGDGRLANAGMRLLSGRPLVSRAVGTLMAAGVCGRVVVATDDDRVAAWADLHEVDCVRVHPPAGGGDDPTAPAVAATVRECAWTGEIGMFDPAAPFRTADTIVSAVHAFTSTRVDSLASVVREPREFWLSPEGGVVTGAHNRHVAPGCLVREAGGIHLVTAASFARTGGVVGTRHHLYEIEPDEGLMADCLEHLTRARERTEEGIVIFRVRANRVIGSGHVHHCLQLAEELTDHRVHFLLRDCDQFVVDEIERQHHSYTEERDLSTDLATLVDHRPAVLVNDVLDTSTNDVLVARGVGLRVVNIEDLGPGARFADRVVNALYPIRPDTAAHVNTGPAYATLRPEFFDLPPRTIRERPDRVLITFGGTDPGHLAARCARILSGHIDATVRVVVGAGAEEVPYPDPVDVVRHVRTMAAEMLRADLVITSAGRTVYEAAATGTPVVVLAQNAREATHAHVGYDNGVIFLGIGALVDDDHILKVVTRVLSDHQLRLEVSERLRAAIDGRGSRRIAQDIRALLLDL